VQAANLLLIGASVRAAAGSALRAGLAPWCIDLFADADLCARCPAMQLAGRYPQGFLEALERAPPGPWLYTGALENHAFLVGQLADRRRLWGNDAGVLVKARDPEFLARAARSAGLPAPAVARRVRKPPGPGEWLVKPLAGAGGAGIQRWSPGGPAPLVEGVYFQQIIEGEPVAAVYLGDGRRARLLGLTRQLVGEPWLHAAPFHYCGSVGPVEADDRLRRELEALGEKLAYRAGLRGLFGVDGIVREGRFRPVELNPRYTASVEVLELGLGRPALAEYPALFERAKPVDAPPAPAAGCLGKAILFAARELKFPAQGPWERSVLASGAWEIPEFADIPHPGDGIEPGRPVLTMFARSDSVAGCVQALRARALELHWLLWPSTEGISTGQRAHREGIHERDRDAQ
jgi:predicted ATP-grasp superfamily ATP-dependent carboligase